MNMIESCRRITRRSKSNFYYSFFFLPRHQREAIYSVYAFCRCIDDAVDQAPSAAAASEALKQWREQISRMPKDARGHPVLRALSNTIHEFKIPKEYFEELISGVEMDLDHPRYETFESLRPYCHRVASVVGLICVEIFGYRETATREHAVHQGIAFQLTNIIRDVASDARRGRIYIPLEDLKQFGYTESELLTSTYNSAFVALMRFQCTRAREYYRKAQAYLTQTDRRSLLASEIMGEIYYRILIEIERSGYNVFRGKIALPSRTKAAIALKTFIRNRLRMKHALPEGP